MSDRLKQGDEGEHVGRLHRWLHAAGHAIDTAEVEARRFGTRTREALAALQARLGVAVTGELDETTAAAIEEHERAGRLTAEVEIALGGPPSSRRRHPSHPPPGGGGGSGGQPQPGEGVVRGNLVDQDGAPIAATAVAAFDQQLRSETRLGQATTDAKGHYEIRYQRPKPLNLLARAYDSANNILAASATVFTAAAEVEIDLTTAKDGVVRAPSRYTTLLAEVTAVLQGTALADLVENKDTHEVRFVANATGEPFNDVARLYLADKIGTKQGLRRETLFGLFAQRIPATLDAALGDLPDAGIDDAFAGQVMSGVLAHARDTLSAALTAALSANVIPASYGAALDGELSRIDDLRVQSVGGAPYIGGTTALADLLAAGNVAAAVKTAFVKLYADNGGRLDVVWAALRADKTLGAADLAQLDTTLSAGELLGGSLPLVTYAIGQLASPQGAIKDLGDLAGMSQSDWEALVKQVDPTGQSVPSVVPGETLDQRIARFAATLAGGFGARYPTAAVAGGLAKATTSAFQTRAELAAFLAANPRLDIARTNIDVYLADPKNGATPPSPPALAELKTAQRLIRLSPQYTSVEALMSAGHRSAQSIYFQGQTAFVAQMTGPLGGASVADAVFTRAEATYAAALTAFGRFNARMNPFQLPVLPSPQVAAAEVPGIDALPNLQSLFGSLDYCECPDCRSVLSPAAYLVDLLQFLGGRAVPPPPPAPPGQLPPPPQPKTVLEALLQRRPDLEDIALNCNNTNTTIPYIDLVNEILEATVAPPASPPTYIDTTGTSAERRAMPQQVNQAAYDPKAKTSTVTVAFPLSLPFDLAFAETTAYLGGLGTSLASIMALFPAPPSDAVAGASLGINPEMRAVVVTQAGPNATDPRQQPWSRWGLVEATNHLPDPRNPGQYLEAWTDVLQRVFYLLGRSGLTLAELYQLLECRWVTRGATVNVQPWTDAANVVSCSSDKMIIQASAERVNSIGDILDRANRFLRLWRATGLAMWELDWALAPSGATPGTTSYRALDGTFLAFLAQALALRTQLGLPFQEILALWPQPDALATPLETRRVTTHLGDQDDVVPSTYDEVFRNPVLLATWGDVFVAGGQGFPVLTVDRAVQALGAALGLGAGDIQAILARSSPPPAPNQLSLEMLGTLLRYARLASSQSLSVSDLILWIELTGWDPFSSPAGTAEFLRRLAVLLGTGLAAVDLDYLLRGRSETKTALAFTATKANALLDALRTALAKLAPPRSTYAFVAGAVTPPGQTPAYQLQPGQVLSIDVGRGFHDVVFTSSNVANLGVVQPAEIDVAVRAVFPSLFVYVDADRTLRIVNTDPAPAYITIGPATTAVGLGFSPGATATDNGEALVQSQSIAYPVTPPAGTITFAVDGAPDVTATFPGTAMKLEDVVAAFNATLATGGPVAAAAGPSAFRLFGAKPGGSVQIVGDSAGGALLTALGLTADLTKGVAPAAGATPTPAPVVAPDRLHSALTQALAAATGTTANVVDPPLLATRLLPLSSGVIGALVAQSPDGDGYQYDITHFPPLLPALTVVAKAAALFTALRPTADEFAFLVKHAADFGWLGMRELPFASTAISLYTQFERFLQALRLDRRPRARAPKLFDVLGSWLASPPPDATTAIRGAPGAGGLALATALDADADDVTALAGPLGFTAPFKDIGVLSRIASALDVIARYRMKGTTLVTLNNGAPTPETAAAARATFQAQYSQDQWFSAIQPVEDALRMKRRDALVALLLVPPAGFELNNQAFSGFFTPVQVDPGGPFLPGPPSTDQMFGYFLIDPEMSCCAVTTRLLQASLTIQQFVQRCYLGLERPVVIDAGADPGWDEWSWRGQFRLWQANRQVFLYPENYLYPELRADKTPLFSDLESDVRQGAANADKVEAAFESYLRKLVDVSTLVVRAHYHETKEDGSKVLHVFARSRATPPAWYYRQRVEPQGSWTAWQGVTLDIASDVLLPVVWDRRLYLFWPVFKSVAVQQGAQSDPTAKNATPPAPPRQFWTIELAFSDLRAGQWQAKRTLREKIFCNIDQSHPIVPAAFVFRAAPDSSSNLRIFMYAPLESEMRPAALGVLPGPDGPLSVTEFVAFMPDESDVDLAQEPSFSLVDVNYLAGLTGFGMPPAPAPPAGFVSWAQDFVSDAAPATDVSLYVTAVSYGTFSGNSTADVLLLPQSSNPHIIIPQTFTFDSTEPFFVSDDARSFFVQPHSIYVLSTGYALSPFYHPFARTFLRELEIGGVDRLMQRNLQENPEAVRGWHFNFLTTYGRAPSYSAPSVLLPLPVDQAPGSSPSSPPALDFDFTGAYSLYNWELFYHAPMFMASLLMQNRQYADAMKWLEYVFDPTDASNEPAPGRYWITRPLHEIGDWQSQQVQQLLQADAQSPAANDPRVTDWMSHPYDPFRVANLRPGAYGLATVMRFLDNLIAWGDALFSQDTMESVNQAEQLYILASMILGPAPERVRLPARYQPDSAGTATYAALHAAGLDQFTDPLVDIENVIPPPALSLGPASNLGGPRPVLPRFLVGTGKGLFFCVPPNDTLLAYWDTVADRLDKIRNCKNIAGAAGQPALYAPPINPLALIEAAQAGATSFNPLGSWQPVYRFSTYLQKAVELTNDVRSLGASLLSALEKSDVEALAVLRSGQEVDILTRMRDVKVQQVTEATDQVAALQAQQAVVRVRQTFYTKITTGQYPFMNASENQAIAAQGQEISETNTATDSELTASAISMLPDLVSGVLGFGGSPAATLSFGGSLLAKSASAYASYMRGQAAKDGVRAQMASTTGSYQRRADEWTLQLNIANAELSQLAAQITAAQDRLTIATKELDVHDRQITNAQAIDDFLHDKYTNGQLYSWMATQLTNVYTAAYQLALDLAQKANAAYDYELGTFDTFITTAYWNDQYKGLQAGESLLLDLRRMEAAYLDANTRELELTKQISLALTQPEQLVMLRETGSCTVTFTEELFDRDHPGHYFRRLRSVALTVPCVTGPYTGVNATLTLGSSAYRTTERLPSPYPPVRGGPSALTNYTSTGGGVQIATSTGQNDAGLFEVNLRDERWLPFEGRGAISNWSLVLDPADNAFDLSTITDVVFHVRYTARPGSNAGDVRTKLDQNARSILVSVRDTFSDAYDAFLHPADASPAQQTLALALAPALFPYSNLGRPRISEIDVYVVANVDPGVDMAATLAADGSPVPPPAPPPPRISPVAGTWWMKGLYPFAPAASAGGFTLTLPLANANVPPALALPGTGALDPSKMVDVLLVITYSIGA